MGKTILVAKGLTDLDDIANKILAAVPEERIFAVDGKMGAGKTTLIKALCKSLDVREVVSSPTFALVNEYTGGDLQPVFHFDFYRIKKIEEVYDIGYEEYFYSDSYCFIEWPELVTNLLPERYVKVELIVGNNEKRTISFEVVE